ncbi:hypothetical protein CASFOL_039518 [Castilleja foliolosa]|uniref:MADS-box domain-containing protein n=1 Tax=Castilleja foliolosa TaxID=1961234 RepID=A0ABD3BIT3_9LAMI
MDKGKKKTAGRRKIPLDQKIQKKTSLQVAFSKRRQGLYRKASELSVLCGAEIAILVRSPAGKIFAYGSSSADAVIGRLEGGTSCLPLWQIVEQMECRRKYEEAARRLERLKKMMMQEGDEWEKSIETMSLLELEQFEQDLDKFRGQIN